MFLLIHNGGTAGTDADWSEIEGADITDAEVRGALSASAGIDFNSATGEFTADQGEIRGFFAAGSGLSYDSSNGTYSLNVDSDGISEGSSNLYFTESRARNALSVGQGLGYNSGTGQIQLTANTSDIGEHSSNLYFTQQRARDAFTAPTLSGDTNILTKNNSGELAVSLNDLMNEFSAGTGLQFDGQGQYSVNATTSDISEGTRLYFTDARARNALSVGQGLGYNSGTGQIQLTANTSDIGEHSSNLYFTDARARTAIAADPAAGNLVDYDSSTGEILVALSKFRKTFAPQNLTANTFATLNHQLGEKIVHVSAYDSNGDLVQLDVQLVDNNNVKVKSVINVTGAQIVVSL
jgi:hypothetical protein